MPVCKGVSVRVSPDPEWLRAIIARSGLSLTEVGSRLSERLGGSASALRVVLSKYLTGASQSITAEVFDGLYVVLVDALADRNDGEKVTDADREALAVVLADRHRDEWGRELDVVRREMGRHRAALAILAEQEATSARIVQVWEAEMREARTRLDQLESVPVA